MLSAVDNALLTRVEGSAPMGRMLRDCFWIPAVRAARLEQDGQPLRVRLFGENFVAFRATDGRVGFLDEACPHRRASLLLARNKDCALRCVFHGWKIDVSGKVVEVPNEPNHPEAFAARVKVNSYPVREVGGLIWVYLGGWDSPPKFPDLEFTRLPPEQVLITSTIIPCNWVQGVEATLDDGHVNLLHASYVAQLPPEHMKLYLGPPPRYEIEMKPYGFEACAVRELEDGRTWAAMTQFAMPWYCFVSSSGALNGSTARQVFFATPVDDTTLQQWAIFYDTSRPVDAVMAGVKDYDPDNFCPPLGDASNLWGRNNEAFEAGHCTGFVDNLLSEDTAVQLSMGPINDRSREHLCSADRSLATARRVLIQAAREYADGKLPAAAHPDVNWRDISVWTREIGPGEDWRDGRDAWEIVRFIATGLRTQAPSLDRRSRR